MSSTLSSSSNLRTDLKTQLNSEQQQAVVAPDQPALVLAGAGTGKTRVMVHRVGFWIAERGILPEHILALTFSRKAADQMQQRIVALVGPDADSVTTQTFHGFCHAFIKEHSEYFKLDSEFALLDQREAWIHLSRLLPELNLKIYTSLADPEKHIADLLKVISRMKDELIDTEAFSAYVQALPVGDERIAAEEVLRVYLTYEARKQELGCRDFGDLVFEVVRVLQANPELLATVQAQYKAIVVDEFQDTNVAQIALLELLAREHRNLSVVGDDDQAIYRFRGASFSSFLQLQELFPELKTMRLEQNYRSQPAVLTVAQRLIQHNNPDRFDANKQLLPASTLSPEAVVAQHVEDDAQEAIAIVEQLKQWQQAGTSWQGMAVLYRAHSHREALLQALEAAAIPYTIRGGMDVFRASAIQDVLAFLKVALHPEDDIAFFRLLSQPALGIPDSDLLLLSHQARNTQQHFFELELKASETLSPQTQDAFLCLKQDLGKVRRFVARVPLREVARAAIERTFLKAAFHQPDQLGVDGALVLANWFGLVERYLTTAKTPSVEDFLAYTQALKMAGGLEMQLELGQDQDAVQVMTVHQAKGLEFERVAILSCIQGRFPSRARREAIPFPESLMKTALPEGDFHLQEERRLFYVALTRAQQSLVCFTQDRPYRRPSRFLEEIWDPSLAGEEMQRTQSHLETPPRGAQPSGGLDPMQDQKILSLLQLLRLSEPGSEQAEHAQAALTTAIQAAAGQQYVQPSQAAQHFEPPQQLSFSQLEAYQDCPQKYLYKYIYRIPTPPTPAMAFGTDLHAALENFFNAVIDGAVPSEAALVEDFTSRHKPGRYGNPAQDATYFESGQAFLKQFYEGHEGKFPKPLHLEKTFSLNLGDFWLRGVIDRVDPCGGGIEVIDYKSGKPKTKASFDEQLQLRLYALACRELFGLETKQISFYYLKDNSKLSFDQTEADYDKTQARLLEWAQDIHSGSFEPAPSTFRCRWCDFRRLCPASEAP